MPDANPDKEACEKAFSQMYDFFMEGRIWTPEEDMDAYFAWHEGVPNAEWLPDFWDDTAEPDFLLWLLGRVWTREQLLRPWRAWYGLERFIDECQAAAGLDPDALEAPPVERHGIEELSVWFAIDGPSLLSRARRAVRRATEQLAVDDEDAARVRSQLADTLRQLVENPFTEEAGFIIPSSADGSRESVTAREGDPR